MPELKIPGSAATVISVIHGVHLITNSVRNPPNDKFLIYNSNKTQLFASLVCFENTLGMLI